MAMEMDKPGNNRPGRYDHKAWQIKRGFLRFLLRAIGFTILVRIEAVEGLSNIPEKGPAILLINHIAFIDPIVVVHLAPRNIVPLAKIEAYDLPVLGIIPKLWGVIPVRRESVDRQAIRHALEVLQAGEIILIAPEGTRSTALANGKDGAAYLASRSNAPIIPVGIDGTIGFPSMPFLPRWREAGVRVRFGKPFRYKPDYRNPNRAQIMRMTEEAMIILAQNLPEARRGIYADRINEKLETIEYL